jgi:hypothetical protein
VVTEKLKTGSLDLDCLDRLYLHGHLDQRQVGGQLIQFLEVFFQRWLARLPAPLGAADQQAGYWRSRR